jgi:selenocysteine lyase/cysteine desulfurase
VPTLFFYDKSCLSKAEYGTAPYESLAGWMASLHYYQEEVGGGERGAPLTRAGLVAAFDAVAALEAPLKRALLEGLVALPGVEVFGSHALEDRVGTVAFRVRGVTPEAVALQLGERGICVGNGNFYALLPNEALYVLRAAQPALNATSWLACVPPKTRPNPTQPKPYNATGGCWRGGAWCGHPWPTTTPWRRCSGC